jgi:hypothetical protein
LDSVSRKRQPVQTQTGVAGENHRWHSGQIPKNSNLWVTALKPFLAAMRFQFFQESTLQSPRLPRIGCRPDVLHQQHLARAFDGGSAALVMRRQAGVFARQDAALVGHELLEQGGVLEIQRVDGEVNLRLGPRRATLAPLPRRAAALAGFSGLSCVA